LLSLAANGTAPYRTVLTHGFLVDADREKISKSKQSGYEKPQTSEAYVGRYGADIVRLWTASQDYRNDIVVSEERVNKVGETYRLLRNTLRFQLSNLYDFNPQTDFVPAKDRDGLDLWFLAKFLRLEQQIAAAYAACEFHSVYQHISQFVAVDLSAQYHDLTKDRLYTDAARSLRRRSTQSTFHEMAARLCQMLSPILPFTADEAWAFIPEQTESVHLSVWDPQAGASLLEEFSPGEHVTRVWNYMFEWRESLALPALEKARQSKLIGKSLEAKITLTIPPDLLSQLEPFRANFAEILNVSQLLLAHLSARPDGSLPDPQVAVAPADGTKCERCWHFETDVGSHSNHPGLCSRCVEAVAACGTPA